jgi:AraC-like DNA-binding protein
VGDLFSASREGFEDAFRRLASTLRPAAGPVESIWLTEKLANVCWRAATTFHREQDCVKLNRGCRLPPVYPFPVGWGVGRKTPQFLLRLWLSRFLKAYDGAHPEGLPLHAATLLRRKPTVWVTEFALARKLGSSPSVLCRRFQTRYGLTPKAYHTRVRVRAAIHHLRNSDLKVDAVARRAGYQNATNFYSALAALTGKTPSAIRQLETSELQDLLDRWLDIKPSTLIKRVDLIRFGGHLPKGGYDVRNGGNTQPTAPSAIHG